MARKPTYEELEQRVMELEKEAGARRGAEKELKYEKSRLKSLLEQSSLAIVTLDEKHKIVSCNRYFEKIFQFKESDITGKNLDEVVAGQDYLKDATAYTKKTLKGEAIHGSGRRYRKDGTLIDVEFYGLPVIVEGAVIGAYGIYQDISERKQVEEALQFTQFAIDHSSDPVFWMRADAHFIYVNEAACHALGYSREELLKMTVHDIDPDFPQEVWPDHWAELKRRGFFIVESHHRTKDGKVFPIEIAVNYLEFGGKEYHCAFARDITARKLSEEALRREEEKFRVLVENSPLGISLIDDDGHYKYFNPKFIEILGYTLEDIPTGREWFRKAYPDPVYRDEVISTWIDDLKKSRSGEARPRMFNVRCKDGSKKEIFFRPVSIEAGENLVTYEDITEQKKLETQLRQAQKMESIGTLAGGIAHDFNNILFPIIGYTEMTVDEVPEGSTAHRNLKKILSSALRARDLVQQILTFSRQQDQELKPLKTQIVVREALKLLRSSLPTTIEIRQDIEKDCGMVMADPTQIHQIVMNLCTNAYHAMDETGGTLEVNLNEVELTVDDITGLDMEPGPYLCLKVGDTGHGMDQSVIERIFDPYFTTKETGKGTGLGLAVVHGIVKSYGGDIRVYSELGKGSVFHVYLPRIKEATVTAETVSDEELPKGHERILLVDDEEAIVSLEKQMMERLGYHVTARTSSIEALEAFREQPDKFDLVITDMTMPNMTGDKLAGELMKIRPDIPVIICTGFSEKMSRERADTLGIKGFLMKPIAMKDLANMLREALDDIDKGD